MAKFSQDNKMKELFADAAATAIIEEYLPGASTDPKMKMGMGMTLKAMCGFPATGISKDKLAEIDAKLQALG